jgi:hypothetical protein
MRDYPLAFFPRVEEREPLSRVEDRTRALARERDEQAPQINRRRAETARRQTTLQSKFNYLPTAPVSAAYAKIRRNYSGQVGDESRAETRNTRALRERKPRADF